MRTIQFVGVDVAKDKFDVALKVSNNWLSTCFANNKKGYQAFSKWLEKHTQKPLIVMEATGHYSTLIADYLCENAIHVSIINPLQIKNYARAKLTRNKTDALDAKIIADFGEKMQPREYLQRSDAQKELKELINLLATLKQQYTRLNNQLHSAQSKMTKIRLKRLLRALIKEIEEVEKHIADIVKKDTKLSEQMDLITSIPGIGKLTAYQILSSIVDIGSFRNAKQFAAYVGISPKQNQSGLFHGRTTISRLGDHRLRKGLYMAAMVAKRFNKAIKPFAQRLKDKGKAPKAVTCAVMRKLVHFVFAVLKSKKPFKLQNA